MKKHELENEIMELIDTQEDYTRGDLQGVVMALVMRIAKEGVEA